MKVKGGKDSSRATGDVGAHDTLRSTAAVASCGEEEPPSVCERHRRSARWRTGRR